MAGHLLAVGDNALPLDALIDICRDVLRGLMYLHTRPNVMIHFDLKPPNVIMFR